MTSARVSAGEWQPRGIPFLEPAAMVALKRERSTSIVAGPGAGKTELLAQRAAYLLETGACPAPYRILAISFKTDAAENLAARVRMRCAPEFAGRFVSVTFDAFTKGLLDRFSNAIPAVWRPTRPYRIAFPTYRTTQQWIQSARDAAPDRWKWEVEALKADRFESDILGTCRLPPVPQAPTSAAQFAILHWWRRSLRAPESSSLSFLGINRLAELILRASPQILQAMRATFPFVFVDEFQDTTFAQYDFLKTAFLGSQANVTAVGDYKQRIMMWAGARPDAFDEFERDFGAKRVALLFNFRSSPELVRVQHVVALAMDAGTNPTVSQAAPELNRDIVQVWRSNRRDVEARSLAAWLASDMTSRGKSPRDYAVLVRQKAEEFEQELQPAFIASGLTLRNESKVIGKISLQDLMADDVAMAVYAILRLGARERSAEAWRIASAYTEVLLEVNPEDPVDCLRAEAELDAFLARLRSLMDANQPNADSAKAAVDEVYSFLGMERIVRSNSRYHSNDLAQVIRDGVVLHLASCADAVGDWHASLRQFGGTHQVPLLTVHKSKGLEYDTIAFIGLDDNSWWSHTPGNPEGLATFFVALSRAKQRALFLFCQARGSRTKVADLYQLLANAGVQEVSISA